ncbi:MAG: SxtJ family membrane protein [Saprospiraceae bacterium]
MQAQTQHRSLAVFVVGCGLLSWLLHQPILGILGLAIGLLGWIYPAFGRLFLRFWLGLGTILGTVNGQLLLGLLFWFVLSPLALLRRMFSGPGILGKTPPENSNFITRNHDYRKADLERPF